MEILSIIFCVITILMLSALGISIIKNDDKNTANREKRYILLYLFSFITLMVSSIFSTLKLNTISIILFILFVALIILATLNYYKWIKKTESRHTKPLLPKKLKKNLKVIKDTTDGYTYKIKTELNCCDNEFEIKIIKDDKLEIVYCICSKCKKEYEIFNSELDGYKLTRDNDIKIISNNYENKRCSKCDNELFSIEINYEYIESLDEIKELKKVGIKDTTNLFTSMQMNASCTKCNNKEKEITKYEYK